MDGLWPIAMMALGAGALAFVSSGCSQLPEPHTMNEPVSPNRALLDEIEAARTWFHAKKTRPIWARRLDHDQTVDTLEGRVVGRTGDYLCRGAAGELWPQKAASLEARYLATDTLDADGWRQYAPLPDAEGVMAAPVPHPFTVTATWGQLAGKAGDYVLKNFRDQVVAYPEDVWVVDRSLFQTTYEAVPP